MNEDKIVCPSCNNEMKYLGNVSNMIYASNPPQWDDVWTCDKCKTKKTVRVHGKVYVQADLSNYTEIQR